MKYLFNNDLEISLRMLIILYIANSSISYDRIIAYDFISTYAKVFSLSDKNLHGDNTFCFGEFATRRETARNPLNESILKGYIITSYTPEGVLYKISPSGISLIHKLNDDYEEKYRNQAFDTIAAYSALSDIELLDHINTTSFNMIGGSKK